MTPKEKALDLVGNLYNGLIINLLHKDCEGDYAVASGQMTVNSAKQCALIAVKLEYHSLREQLFNLRSCHVIESEKVYLARLDSLNQEESQVRTEIENL